MEKKKKNNTEKSKNKENDMPEEYDEENLSFDDPFFMNLCSELVDKNTPLEPLSKNEDETNLNYFYVKDKDGLFPITKSAFCYIMNNRGQKESSDRLHRFAARRIENVIRSKTKNTSKCCTIINSLN